MRRLFLVGFLLLAGCEEAPWVKCTALDTSRMTPEMQQQAIEYCRAAEAKIAQDRENRPPRRDTLTDRMLRESEKVGMHPVAFADTMIGREVARDWWWDRYTGTILGFPLILFAWIFVIYLIRTYTRKEAEVERVPVLGGLFHRNKVMRYRTSTATEGEYGGITFALILGAIYTFAIYGIIMR
jgi:hypothetical protein